MDWTNASAADIVRYCHKLELDRAADQKRMAKELDRVTKEQARQAAVLAKQGEEIRKFSYRLEKAEDEIARFTEVLDSLADEKDSVESELADIDERISFRGKMLDARSDRDWEKLKNCTVPETINACMNKNDVTEAELIRLQRRRETLKRRLEALDGKIFNAEQKLKKAEYERYEFQVKLRNA